ncbi:MAG: MarR family transcriptional regulator [Candidatus Thorarchaeota archaeon]
MSDQVLLEFKKTKLTQSQVVILEIVEQNGTTGTTPKEIQGMVSFAPRTIRYALRSLQRNELIRRIPCLQDMRQSVYIPV